jgi:hypothetical protein
MLSRLKFEISPLVNEILDQLPAEVWTSETTTFLDPAIGGGQFIYAIEQRLRSAGHSDDNINGRVYGCENSKLSVQYAKNKYKLVATLGVGDFLNKDFTTMKFDVVVGNPPFSLAGNKTGKKGRAKNLYPEFYEKSVKMAKFVAMIVPNTSRQNIAFNSFIRDNTNKIILINDGTFAVNISTWCLIKDATTTKVKNIDWADLQELPTQKVKWAKGKINVTTENHLLVNATGPYTVYHKVNGKGLLQTTTNIDIPSVKLFPSNGYAVIMPQQIQKHGWTNTSIVKCNGKQAATNGVNIAFVKTRKEAEYLVDYMKSSKFISQAMSNCGGMNNMTLTAMKKIEMNDYNF